MSTPENLQVRLFDRDHNGVKTSSELGFTINRYSKTINGGCKDAYITAYGNEHAMWRLANMLRYGLYVYDNKNIAVWWGYIAEVKIRAGNLVFGASIDTMSNKIAVVYTSFGSRNKTAFKQDEFSVGEYGTKELLSVVSDATNDEALQRRDSDLAAKKLPTPTVEFEAQPQGSFSANIIARGYYDTLGWKYYSQDKGLVEHSNNGTGQQSLAVILSSACLVFDSSNNEITDWSESLSPFKKGSRVTVTDTSSNDGMYTVSQGGSSGCGIKVEENLSDETNATATLQSAYHIAQKFKQVSGSSWDASSIHVRIQPSGSPTDDLVVNLYTESGASPDAKLTSGCYAASDMAESMAWTEIPLSASVTLANNTSYYVRVHRSTACPTSPCQYYKVDMDEGLGYENGDFVEFSYADGWVSRTTDADMLFKVVGTQPVVDQIKEIGANAGQFLVGATSEIASACSSETNQYRDGETTALTEIDEMLKVGTKGGLRMLAEVTSDRRLMISEQADRNLPFDSHYRMTLDGRVEKFKGGEEVPNYECPVGIWTQVDTFMPATFDQSYLANPGMFFIEECEYYVQSDRIVPRSIDTSNVWELGKVKDG